MKKIASFANQMGGVGKTTCTVNIGFELTNRGYSVLLIDLDPQGNMTSWCGQDPDSFDRTIYDVLKGTERIEDTVIEVSDKLSLVPANILLASIEREIFAAIGYERRL